MAPGADKNCSWSATPASKKGKDETCAVEEGHSTPVTVRNMREGILRSKQAREERHRACTPDPALQTIRGFVVDPRKAAPADHRRAAAAESASATMAEPSEVTLAHVTSTARTHQAANQAAMQRNRLINVVAADAAIAANNTKPPVKPQHVKFAPDVKAPQPNKKKARSLPPPPPPTPSQQQQLTATATAPRRIGINTADTPRVPPWTESYRCVYKNPDCPTCADEDALVCHRTCHGATAWCGGDKRFVPHMAGPHRRPDGSEGKPIPEFDVEEVEEDSVKF
ncbi:hypothetical protein PG991_001226 [Apiospora marii]|uniref:C2H2-type domain-containing protein n=1 Tax=Apiospora marii TaxID=335849 RepID=A0ABR1SRG8_9PEZI